MADNQFLMLLMSVVAGIIAIYYGFQSSFGDDTNYILVVAGIIILGLVVIMARKFVGRRF